MPDDTSQPRLDGTAFAPVDPARAPAEQIYDGLKSAILRMDLRPGLLISEAEIGAGFGASRTPVREAFALLRADGLIVTRPSRGNYVAYLSETAIRQAQFLREGLELANVDRLCREGLPQDIAAQLSASLEAQAAAVEADDSARFHREDDEFHALLARATGFARAETLLVREKAVLDRLRVLSLAAPDHRARLLADHRAIHDAIRARDGARAAEVTRAHLRSGLGALSSMMQDHEGFFE